MSIKFALLQILLYISGSYAIFYKTNVTDYNSCTIYYTRFESGYKQFFVLPEAQDQDLLIDFHFAVLAISDAHILLAASPQVKVNDSAYEIVIGAGGNTFSDIRRKQKGSVRTSYRKKGLLSAVDVTGFWIHIYKNGLIDVGKEGEKVGFMNWTDPELLNVRVFTFAGWGNVEAKWFFNCPRNNTNATDPKSLRPQTETDRLREYILNLNESHNDVVKVYIQLTSNYVSINEKDSILNLKGRANFLWTFSPIMWDPVNYSGLDSVVLQQDEIWRPEVIVVNAIDIDHIQPFISNTLIARHNGQVLWQPSFDILTYCSLNGVENWPNDIHECDIHLGTSLSQYNFVEFDVAHSSATIQLNTVNNYDSEWYIEEGPNIHIYKITNTNYSPATYLKFPQSLKLRITIKRKTSFYETAFRTPLLIIATMMLLNFWCSTFDYIKVSLIAAQILLTCMGSIGLAITLPAHKEKIPIIVYRYSAVAIANIINLIICVTVINLSRSKHVFEPTHIIGRIVKNKIVEKLLLLPELAPPMVPSPYPAVMETIRRRSRVQDVWIRLSMCIERIAFLIYLSFIIPLIYIN